VNNNSNFDAEIRLHFMPKLGTAQPK